MKRASNLPIAGVILGGLALVAGACWGVSAIGYPGLIGFVIIGALIWVMSASGDSD